MRRSQHRSARVEGIVLKITMHLQSIAADNGIAGSVMNGCIAATSGAGYFATFSQAPGKNAVVQQVVLPNKDYAHVHIWARS